MAPQDRFLFTRRESLRSAAVAGLGLTLPQFLTESAWAAMTPEGTPLFTEDRILVVVQLGGGNDGLNTVVPIANDAYHKARKNLALKGDTLFRLNDEVALNPGMKGMKGLFDDGRLAVVQGVGYPNPDRSHFRSMEIWHTATDSDRFSRTGWLGRYFDNCCGGRPVPTVGVHVGGSRLQAFDGRLGAGVSFPQPDLFRWNESGRATRRAFDALNKVSAAPAEADHTIDFLRHTTANAVVSSDRVQKASGSRGRGVDYPAGQLGTQLRTVANLIAGNLPTRIYYTSMTGFDTHANQSGQHENLLRQFSDSIAAFTKDLKAIGAADRVMVMCFSEFGRRVEENASRGTDHGTAGPMFLLGPKVKPGLHAQHPSLTDLDGGDLKHTVDFRSVYAEVLRDWMGAAPEKVLGKGFEGVGVLG